MVPGAKKRVQDEYQLELSADNHAINKVTKQRLLGIIIDDHLSWTAHIGHLCSTLATKSRFSDSYPHTCLKMYKNVLPKLYFTSAGLWKQYLGNDILC